VSSVGIVSLWQETNTYSSRPTTLEDFAGFELLHREAVAEQHSGTRSVIGGMLDADAFEVVPVFSAGAWPAGPADWATLEELFGRLERELLAAGRLDGILLNLHGAMVCEGVDDVELETVRLIRKVVGGVPLAAVHDLHGNPSPELVDNCEVVIAYDTYPHVDMYERGAEAAALLAEMLDGRELRTVIGKVPLLSCPLAQATAEPPMRDLQAKALQIADEAGMRRISLLPGFPYSDVERAGFSVLVVHDADRRTDSQEVAAALCAEVDARTEDFALARDNPATAVRKAIAAPQGPVLIADVADNIGGGSPGDGTAILAELFAQHADGAVVLMAEPDLAREAARVGEGSEVDTDVGAKTDNLHGSPLRVRGQVRAVTDGRYRSGGTWMTGRQFCMGTTAVVDANGVVLVAMERATPPFHSEQLTSVGIQAAEAKIIVVKGAVAWRAAYGEIAAEVIEVDTPGVCPLDPSVLERSNKSMRTCP
jgi:microcystin degradation protein MlrC